MEHRKRVKMVLEYSNKYQTEVKGYDDIYGKGKSAEAVGALDASAKYLSCMGLFYWSLGILTVTRMVTQGLGYSGRTVFSGVAEMVARAVVSLGFVGTFGYTAICLRIRQHGLQHAVTVFRPACGAGRSQLQN